MFCGNCGKQLSDEAAFCAECGTKISTEPEPLLCGNCKAPLPKDAVFCSECGTKTDIIEGHSLSNPVNSTAQKEMPKKPILAAVLAIIVLASGYFFFTSKSDKDVNTTFRNNNTNTANKNIQTSKPDVATKSSVPLNANNNQDDTFSNNKILNMLKGQWRSNTGNTFYVTDTLFSGFPYVINHISQTDSGHKAKAYIFCDIAPSTDKNARKVPMVVIMTFYRGTFLQTFSSTIDGDYDEDKPVISASKQL